MLSKKHKISREEFPNSTQKGSFYNSQHITLIVRMNEKQSKNTKFSITISKKIEKKAVLRNKIKRRAYYAVKKVIDRTKDNILATLILKKDIQSISYRQLEDQILSLLKTSKII